MEVHDQGGGVEGAVVGGGGAGGKGAGVVAFFHGVGELKAVLEEAQVAQGGRGIGEGGGIKQDAGLGGGRRGRWRDGALPVEAAGRQAGRCEQKRDNAEGGAHALQAIVAVPVLQM